MFPRADLARGVATGGDSQLIEAGMNRHVDDVIAGLGGESAPHVVARAVQL
jgi:hypothetical protein